MKTVKVNKAHLLETLLNNKETHEKDFEIAWDAFRERAIDNASTLVDTLKNMHAPQEVNLWIGLDVPENHSGDYQRAIEMVEWEVGDEVVLTEQEFKQYVQDSWVWKGKFASDNQFYTESISPSSIEVK